MILVDETKLDNNTLYNIISANGDNVMKEEFRLKYNKDWLELRHKNLATLQESNCKDMERIMKMWEISGESVDCNAYIDYYLDFLCMYNNTYDVKEGLIDILTEIKEISNDLYDDIIKSVNNVNV